MSQLQINVIKKALAALQPVYIGEQYLGGDAGKSVSTAVVMLETAMRQIERAERPTKRSSYSGPYRRKSDLGKTYVSTNND